MINILNDNYTNSKNDYNYEREKNGVNKNEYFNLDNIMVLRIGKNDKYAITILSLKQDGSNDRFLLSTKEKEISVIEKCLNDNLELERTSILDYMPSDYVELYNETLRKGDYEWCLKMLHGLEQYINTVYKECKNEVNLQLVKRK